MQVTPVDSVNILCIRGSQPILLLSVCVFIKYMIYTQESSDGSPLSTVVLKEEKICNKMVVIILSININIS